jgi:hypothetical protein
MTLYVTGTFHACVDMWFVGFIVFCLGVMVWDIVSDPHFKTKLKELEEE